MPESAGARYIGVYGGNGSVNVSADYVRFTPDSPNDAAAPVTTHTVPAADGAAGWHRTPVNVALAAADDGECVSGVDKTEFRVGGGAFAAYTVPVSITADGTHVLEYRSTDKAGNAETAKSATVKLDATAPTTTASVAQTGAGPATLTLNATDATSGVALTEFRADGSALKGLAAQRFAAPAEWMPYSAASKPVLHGQRHVRGRVPVDGRRRATWRRRRR